MALARELGAVASINGQDEDVVRAIREITKGGAHVSIDALGSQITCVNSIKSLRKQGKHIQVGLMAGEYKDPKIPMGNVIADELELLGSHGMQAHKYPEMLEMIRLGKLAPQHLIEKHLSLEQAVDLLPKMDQYKGNGITVINQF